MLDDTNGRSAPDAEHDDAQDKDAGKRGQQPASPIRQEWSEHGMVKIIRPPGYLIEG
jgi:hypothetical protein